MPTLEDVIEQSSGSENTAATSPSASETSAVTSPSASEEAVTSTSASEKAPEAPKSLDDAILKVVEPKPDTQDTAKAEEVAAEPDAKPDEGQPKQNDPDEAEMANYSEKARKRIIDLVGQRDEWKQQAEAYRVDAEYARQLGTYLERNSLTAEDTNLGLGIMAALRRGDFQVFLDGIRPYVEAAETAVGARLPADLQEQVEQGLVPEETARRLSVREYEAQRLRAEAEARAQADAHASAAAQANAIHTAVTNFEANLQQTDPDFGAKQAAMRKFARAIVAEKGPPRDVNMALEYARQAHKEATDFLVSVRPKATPTRPTPTSGQHSNVPAVSKPKSFEAAIDAALTAGRSGL